MCMEGSGQGDVPRNPDSSSSLSVDCRHAEAGEPERSGLSRPWPGPKQLTVLVRSGERPVEGCGKGVRSNAPSAMQELPTRIL